MSQIRSVTLIALFALVAAFGAGCDAQWIRPGQQLEPEPGMAAAQGYVVQVNPVFIVADLSDAPPGAVPAIGAYVRVVDIEGTEVASVRAGPAGAFGFTSLPPGYLRFEVRIDPSSAEPDATADVTAYPGAAVALNQDFPISRKNAIDRILAEIDEDALVMASMQPLLGGVTVVPNGGPPEEAPAPDFGLTREVQTPEWFFFVRDQAEAKYASPCRYGYVDAQTGAVTMVEGVFWPPLINGELIWGSNRELFRFVEFDPEDPDFDELSPDADAIPSPEIVQLPPSPTGPAQLRGISLGDTPSLQSHNFTADSIFAILLQAAPEPYEGVTILEWSKFLQQGGVPFENIHKVVSHRAESIEGAKESYRDARRLVEAEIRNRFARGEHSTLVVVVVGHGAGGKFCLTWHKRGSYTDVGPEFLDLPSTQACRVRVFLEFCYTRLFGDGLDAEFQKVPDAARPDHVIYCAAGRNEFSYGRTVVGSFFTFSKPGGKFSTSALGYATVAGGDIRNLLNADHTDIREELESLFGGIVIGGNVFFHPNAIVHEGEPEFCRITEDDGLATVTPDSLPFDHEVGVTPCPQTVGTIEVKNNTDGIVSFSAVSADAAIQVDPLAGTIPPGGTRTLTVLFNCTRTTSFSTTVTVFVANAETTETHNVQVSGTVQ